MSGVGSSSIVGAPSERAIFASAGVGGPEVGHRRRKDGDVGGEIGDDVEHVLGGFHPMDDDPFGRRELGGGHEVDGGGAAGGFGRHRMAHAARRSVPEVPNRIQRFTGPPGGHQHGPAGERPVEQGGDRRQDRLRFGHASHPLVAAGQGSRLGSDHVVSVLLDERHGPTGGGMLPHLGVHRRRHQDGRPRGEEGGREDLVGEPVSEAGEGGGGGRRHDHHLGPAAEVGMGADRRIREQPGQGMAAGDGSEGGGTDEGGGCLGHDDANLGPLLDEAARQVDGLVGGDSSGHAEHDPAADEHHSSTVSTATLPSEISSMAMVRGLREKGNGPAAARTRRSPLRAGGSSR